MSKKLFTKDEYLLRNFSKITHKKWELYVITRVIHLLDDNDLEYVCQQYINPPNSPKYYLADLCFPTLQIYLEVNEQQHSAKEHSINDQIRQREILDATNWEQKNIDVYIELSNGEKIDKPLDKINKEIDNFIKFVKSRKSKKEKEIGKKLKWNFEEKYSPETYINKGYIDVAENTVFLYQLDALKLFGFKGKGYQKGYWELKGHDSAVWFPRLYQSGEWHNTLSKDSNEIVQKRIINGVLKPHHLPKHDRRIVFGRYKNILGQTVYKFYGMFRVDWERTDELIQVFLREETKLDLNKYI